MDTVAGLRSFARARPCMCARGSEKPNYSSFKIRSPCTHMHQFTSVLSMVPPPAPFNFATTCRTCFSGFYRCSLVGKIENCRDCQLSTFGPCQDSRSGICTPFVFGTTDCLPSFVRCLTLTTPTSSPTSSQTSTVTSSQTVSVDLRYVLLLFFTFSYVLLFFFLCTCASYFFLSHNFSCDWLGCPLHLCWRQCSCAFPCVL